MSNKSGDESLQDAVKVMGSDLGPVYHQIWQELTYLCSKWNFVCTISYTQERWQILGQGLDQFSSYLYQELVDSTVSGLMRLLDPKQGIKGDANLTLLQFEQLLPKPVNLAVKSQVKLVSKKAGQLKLIRHKRLSHNDLNHSLGNVNELIYPSRLEITDIFKDILKVLNTIEVHYGANTTVMLTLGNRNALHMLNQFHVFELLMEKELEAARTGMSEIKIGRSEFLIAAGYFKEELAESRRYFLPEN